MSVRPFRSDSEDDESETDDEQSILFPKKKKGTKPITEEDKDHTDSDSSDAPEDVGFSESRQAALEKIRNVLKQISDTKQKAKAKRRKKDELYKQQKIESLQKNRLPDDFLEDLTDDLPSQKIQKTSVESKKLDKDDVSDSEDHLSDDQTPVEDVSLNHSGCVVETVTLSQYLRKQPKLAVERAVEFQKKMLYGNRVPRESVQSILSRRKKKHARCK